MEKTVSILCDVPVKKISMDQDTMSFLLHSFAEYWSEFGRLALPSSLIQVDTTQFGVKK